MRVFVLLRLIWIAVGTLAKGGTSCVCKTNTTSVGRYCLYIEASPPLSTAPSVTESFPARFLPSIHRDPLNFITRRVTYTRMIRIRLRHYCLYNGECTSTYYYIAFAIITFYDFTSATNAISEILMYTDWFFNRAHDHFRIQKCLNLDFFFTFFVTWD